MTKRDLLRKLESVRTTERGIVPNQEWVKRNREILMSQVRAGMDTAPLRTQTRAKVAVKHLIPERLTNLVRGPVAATMSVLLTVLGGSIASVSASERAVPGDFLYPIKIASEQTQLAFVSDKKDKLKLKTEFVERRVQEIKTIAHDPSLKTPSRLSDAAAGLKRDLDTVKLQLADVSANSAPADAAAAAKLVDQKSDAIASELKQVKTDVPVEVKSSISEAEAAAVHTGVSAVQVLIETKDKPDGQNVVSDADVLQSINNKVDNLQNSINDTAQKLQALSTSSTVIDTTTASGTVQVPAIDAASSSVSQIQMASSTLEQAKTLLSQNKLGEISDKLIEAAKTAAQAEASVAQLTASSTTVVPATTSGTSTTETVTTTVPVVPAATSTTTTSTSTKTSTTTVSPP